MFLKRYFAKKDPNEFSIKAPCHKISCQDTAPNTCFKDTQEFEQRGVSFYFFHHNRSPNQIVIRNGIIDHKLPFSHYSKRSQDDIGIL